MSKFKTRIKKGRENVWMGGLKAVLRIAYSTQKSTYLPELTTVSLPWKLKQITDYLKQMKQHPLEMNEGTKIGMIIEKKR